MSDDRKTYRVGFYVEVEVESYPNESHWVAWAATGWPAYPHDEPMETSGELNEHHVTAKIVKSQPLVTKVIEEPEAEPRVCEKCGAPDGRHKFGCSEVAP